MERLTGRPLGVEVGGGGGNESGDDDHYPWYLNSIFIKIDGGNQVPFTKVATNQWTFRMPTGDVVISGTFSQTPTKSNELSILDVNVNSTPPKLLSGQYNYTTEIPHIFPTVQGQKFSIIAIPEDPQADVSIRSEAQEESEEYELNEGITGYTITVKRDGLSDNTYNFTVSYEPDLTLKSITLTSGENEEWIQSVPVQDWQVITVPYGSVTIAASPSDENVILEASMTGSGDFPTGGPGTEWTLTYTGTQNIYAFYSDVKITSKKSINDGDYTKDFILKFKKIVDANWPTSYWAASIPKDNGNGVSIIKEGDKYYEIHSFIASGTLTVNNIPDEGLTARVLVVAGGGGGGSGSWDRGGGGGGGGVGYSESVSLTMQDYVVVAGGGGGSKSKGLDSKFGELTVEGGGRGGDARENMTGGNGGSGGGGGAGDGTTRGDGGSAGTHDPVEGYQFYGSNGDMGSTGKAGGNGGSANFSSNISGTLKEYGKGGIGGEASGNTPAVNGTGNGGNAGNSSGYSGSSGIVIVRFPARPNDTNNGQTGE